MSNNLIHVTNNNSELPGKNAVKFFMVFLCHIYTHMQLHITKQLNRAAYK